MQMILLIKALSYSAGASPEWYVSMSLDPRSESPPPPCQGQAAMLALMAEIQPVQWKRGWQLEKIHSQSKHSVETGMPTFQSSDRSTLGSVPGRSWPNARAAGAHSSAYLSSSQPWSMEPPGSSHKVRAWHKPQNTRPADAGDSRRQVVLWRDEKSWWKGEGLIMAGCDQSICTLAMCVWS